MTIIAFIGPDGSGKSSAINSFSTCLQQLDIPVRTTYLGPWDRPVLPTSRHLQKLRIGPADDALEAGLPVALKTLKQVSANVKRSIYYLNLLFELWARHVRNVLPHLMLRRVVLADRYAFDLEVGHFNRAIRSWRGVRRLIVRLVPRPHFTVLLDNTAETVWKRKKEYSLEVIEAAQLRYRVIADQIGAEVLRTDDSSDAIARIFLEKHWRRLVKFRLDRIRFWSI
jgi:thymidylate kinase